MIGWQFLSRNSIGLEGLLSLKKPLQLKKEKMTMENLLRSKNSILEEELKSKQTEFIQLLQKSLR